MRTSTAVFGLSATALFGYGAVLAVWGRSILIPATFGLAITLPPTVATLILVRVICLQRPDAGPVAVLAGTGLRMVWAVGVVAVLQNRAAEFGTTPTAIAEWTTGFYLLTLAGETALLWRLLSRPDDTPSGVPGHDPTRG